MNIETNLKRQRQEATNQKAKRAKTEADMNRAITQKLEEIKKPAPVKRKMLGQEEKINNEAKKYRREER